MDGRVEVMPFCPAALMLTSAVVFAASDRL